VHFKPALTQGCEPLGKRRTAPLPNRRALRPTPRLEQAPKPDAKRAPINRYLNSTLWIVLPPKEKGKVFVFKE